jgi:hypothetical protein
MKTAVDNDEEIVSSSVPHASFGCTLPPPTRQHRQRRIPPRCPVSRQTGMKTDTPASSQPPQISQGRVHVASDGRRILKVFDANTAGVVILDQRRERDTVRSR